MAKNRIENVVEQYLKMTTSYAILINGKRGIGKTFFVKKNLASNIKAIPVFDDQTKKYIPVYISLYGFKSINDVYTSITYEVMPFLKEKGAQITLALGKMLSRGYMSVKSLGDPDDYLKDLKVVGKKSYDTKNFVLIFDDLDRLSDDLGINEFVGFVNSLVEHDNNKIIIIADRSKIEDEHHLKEVLEKTVGTIVEYTSSFEENYDKIIQQYFSKGEDKEYYEYLVKFRSQVLEIFSIANCINLRILIFFLQHLKIIITLLWYDLKLNRKEDNDHYLSVLEYIIRFSAIITIEFKNGNISYIDRKGIDSEEVINQTITGRFLSRSWDRRKESQEEKDKQKGEGYLQAFLDKYSNIKHYKFLPQIYDFLTGGDELIKEDINQVLQNKFIDYTQPATPPIEVYEKLASNNVYNLKNRELKKVTKELLKYAKAGEYSIDRYLTVFYFIERFNYIYKYNLDKVKDSLIYALRRHRRKFIYVYELATISRIDDNNPYASAYKEIRSVAIEVNKLVLNSVNRNNFSDLFQRFLDNDSTLVSFIMYNHADASIFNYWDFRKFYQHLIIMSSLSIISFTTLIEQRYKYSNNGWYELDFFQKLVDELKRKTIHERSLRDDVYEGLIQAIERFVFKNPNI